MRIPTKVRITSKRSYTVSLVERFSEANTMGLCDPVSRQIILRKNLPPRPMLATFIHELIHAMEFEHGIEISHRAVDQLDSAIEMLLRLNGWLKAGEGIADLLGCD